jgi:hypothetical protein
MTTGSKQLFKTCFNESTYRLFPLLLMGGLGKSVLSVLQFSNWQDRPLSGDVYRHQLPRRIVTAENSFRRHCYSNFSADDVDHCIL